MTLVESRKEALWGLRWMQDAVQNSGKTKPGLYPVIGLLGAAGKLGKERFVNNAARRKHWSIRQSILHQRKYEFIYLSVSNIKTDLCQNKTFNLHIHLQHY